MTNCKTFVIQISVYFVCIIALRGDYMRKFKIPSLPPTTSKSVRFPNDVIDEVELAIQGTNCTFSAFVVEAVRVALDNLKEENSN